MTLTLPKLLIAALVIYFVWRYFSRLGAADRARSQGGATRPGESPRAESGDRPRERAIEDMVKCPKCGAYVPAKGGHDCTADGSRG